MIKKYVKRPIEIEAIQWKGSNSLEVEEFCKECACNDRMPILMIYTLEGPMRASKGDYIIKGVNGEFYPCKKDIFKKTYKEVKTKNNE